jgi:rod shape-determining protein MreD
VLIGLIRGPVGRIFLVGFTLLAFQMAIFAELRFVGVALQVVMTFVAVVAVVGGPEKGMTAAIICGVMFDMAAGSDIGSSALTMGAAALVAGMVAFINIEQQWWISAIFVALGVAVGEASMPFIRAVTGEELFGVADLVKAVPIVAAGAVVMGPILLPIARWSLAITKAEWRVPESSTIR